MKIAMIFDRFLYGGMERVGINHIKLMKELGHEVDAYVLTKRNEEMIGELKAECPVKIVPFLSKYCPDTFWNVSRRFRTIGKYAFPPLYFLLSLSVWFRKIYKTQRKKKYDLAIAFSGHTADLTFVARNFVKSREKACWLHGALFAHVMESQGFEQLYMKIKNIVVLSDDAQNETVAIHRKDGFPNFRITKIYNAVDTANKRVDQQKVNVLKEKYGNFIIMVARLNYPHKDHYTVINALKILKEKYGIQRKLVLLGDGPEYPKLVEFVKKNNLEEDVFFEGNHSNVQDYYSAASVLVHASRSGEGLPTILIEAMNFGLPVVSTDTKTGPSEIIGNNKYGLLCKVGDSNGMAEALNQLFSNPETYSEYSRASLLRAESFKPDAVKQQLADFLNQFEKSN